MSGMNDWLARAYGTNGAGHESDLEKTAQALMLTKLAEAEGIDLSGLDEQQLTLLAQEVAQQMAQSQQQPVPPQPGMPAPQMPAGGGAGGMAPPSAQAAQQPAPMPQAAGAGQAPGAPPEGQFSEEQIKVAQAKMAEADFLGRMMAHALHQESRLIKEGEAKPFAGKETPAEEAKEKKILEEEEAEKTAMAYLAARGYAITKHASAEGPLTRAIRALGGSVK